MFYHRARKALDQKKTTQGKDRGSRNQLRREVVQVVHAFLADTRPAGSGMLGGREWWLEETALLDRESTRYQGIYFTYHNEHGRQGNIVMG